MVTPVQPQVATLPGPITLIKETLSFYGSHFREIVILSSIPAILGLFGAFLLPASGLAALVQLLAVVASVLQAVVLIKFLVTGQKFSIQAAYKDALSVFFPFLLVGILGGLVMMGGAVLLVIPGIFFMVSVMFANVVFLTENKRGFAALNGSYRYVIGSWWAVFGRLIVAYLLVAIVAGIVSSIFSHALDPRMFQAFGAVVSALLVVPLCYIFEIKLFNALKVLPGHDEQKDRTSLLRGFAIWGGVAIIILALVGATVGRTTFQKLEHYKNFRPEYRNLGQDSSAI